MPTPSTFQKAGDALSNNRGKLAAGTGGLSIFLAVQLFASKTEVAALKDRLSEEHRDAMDREQLCEAKEKACVERFTRLVLRTNTP